MVEEASSLVFQPFMDKKNDFGTRMSLCVWLMYGNYLLTGCGSFDNR